MNLGTASVCFSSKAAVDKALEHKNHLIEDEKVNF